MYCCTNNNCIRKEQIERQYCNANIMKYLKLLPSFKVIIAFKIYTEMTGPIQYFVASDDITEYTNF